MDSFPLWHLIFVGINVALFTDHGQVLEIMDPNNFTICKNNTGE